MKKLRITRELTKIIKKNYQNYGYKSSEDFINKIKENNKETYIQLSELVTSNSD